MPPSGAGPCRGKHSLHASSARERLRAPALNCPGVAIVMRATRSMPVQITVLALGAFLLLHSAVGQTDAAMDRWCKTTGNALARFLPNASPWGMTVDPYPPFSGAANETYVYKGADSLVHQYPSYIVHQTWWINDAELFRQMAELNSEKETQKRQADAALQEFMKAHGAEMQAAQKARLAEMEKLSKEGADLYNQGKPQQGQAVIEKLQKLGPFIYPPYQQLTESLDKQQKQIADRERTLSNRRRQVSFQIHTNRTPTTTAPAFTAMKPAGTLGGHPLYRQLRGNTDMGGWIETMVDLAVLLAPPGYENPKVKIGHRELAVKSIVVWAWIESRPDTIQADEAATRKVLESIDYKGLSKLIEP